MATDHTKVVVRIGTRASQLALWQSRHVAAQIEVHWPDHVCQLVHLVTRGDKQLDRPLPEIGGKGLFTAELETALLAGEIDLAVHSLKDLPVADAPGLTIGAVLPREDVRDVLVAAGPCTLDGLAAEAVVGTSSLRRQAQLLALRPDLRVRPIRGNVDTRIRKVESGEYAAAILAGAGLRRLGLENAIAQWLPVEALLPAPGQGALAVQCRDDDNAIRDLLAPLEDMATRTEVTAERRVLWRLGGGCSAPVAALGRWSAVDGRLQLRGFAGSTDGRRAFTAEASGSDLESVADEVAESLLAQGAAAVLPRVGSPGIGAGMRPLAGKRIVVTRAEGQADDLVARLTALGGTSILAPVIAVQPAADPAPLDRALTHLGGYAWVLFTSANAVEMFFRRYDEAHHGVPWPTTVRVAAVGAATATALKEHGLAVDFLPDEALGEALADQLPVATGERVLLPRSAIGSQSLPRGLRVRGVVVDDVATYTTVAEPLAPATMIELARGFDAILFASGSAASAFVAGIEGHQACGAALQQAVIACIGPATAESVRSLGLTPGVIAQEHTGPGLVRALEQHYIQTGSP